MNRYITYYIISLFAVLGLFASCAEENALPASSQEEEEGHVVLSYTVSGSSIVSTRVEESKEEGNKGRNENLVKDLDLFIFRNGTIITNQPLHFTPEKNDQQTGDYTPLETGLAPDDFQNGDQVYLVANCHDVVSDVTTLDVLKAKTVSSLICYDEQLQFVMDGMVTVDAKMWTDKDLHIQIDLKRAAAKVRLHFASSTDWNQVSYRFCHYANTATVLEQEETEEYTYVNSLSLMDYTTRGEELAKAVPIVENEMQCLVLYTYPNNWHDGNPDDDKLNVEPPINDGRETRILLKAPYNEELYYYDIPVNFRLPEKNDDININEDYKDLYRIQRNHIYDITVTIDREGGTVSKPVTPKLYYQVLSFDEETIDIPKFQ